MKLSKYVTHPFSVATLTGLCSVANAAFNDAGTDYSDATQEKFVWNEALQPVELVNSILCFSAQMLPTSFVNDGPYIVLADEARCFDNQNSGQGNQAGSNSASNTPSYMEVTVNVTRDSDTSPIVVNAWIPAMGTDEDGQAIKFKAVVSEGATSENPFGTFTFNFDFFASINDTTRLGGGEVKTVDTSDGQIGFTLYEGVDAGPFSYSQSASVVMNAARTSGTALTASSNGGGGQAYALTFNADNVLVQSGTDYSSLPFQNGDNTGSCLSRTSFNDAVWRYDLFDAQSGERVQIDSGFSFRYDSDNDQQADSYGHVGYWGVWTEQEGALNNGDVIQSEDPTTNTVSQYTVVKAPGRLIKYSVETLALADLRGIALNVWDDSAIEAGFDTWEVNYLTVARDGVAADGFYFVAGITWGETGPERSDVTDVMINLSANEPLYLYSEQLGGDINYRAGDSVVSFFKETYINGSETSNGELLSSGSVTFHCFERCPLGTIATGDLVNYEGANSPYDTTVVNSVGAAIQYTFSDSGASALTLVRNSNSQAVSFASGLTAGDLANSPHQWGMRSGPMVTADVAATMSNPWDIFDSSVVTEYYVWETGIHDWNQLTTVKDINNTIRSFDKPLQFSYRHSDNNDRSGSAGSYDNALVLLNYGGNGDLWGIPHVTDGERGAPAFNIADGVTMGPGNIYVIKALEIEQSMADATGQCTALTIDEPAVAVPTGVTGSADIGSMPVVTDAPKVIAGELQVQQ